jgi:hypothetical protein
VGPAAWGRLVGLALPLKVGVASRVVLARVERAPRQVSEFGCAAQVGVAELGLGQAGSTLPGLWLGPLGRPCLFACLVVEGAQVSGGVPAGALGVCVGQDRLAQFEAVGELLVCVSAGEALSALAGIAGTGMGADERGFGAVLAPRERGGADLGADVRGRPRELPLVAGPACPQLAVTGGGGDLGLLARDAEWGAGCGPVGAGLGPGGLTPERVMWIGTGTPPGTGMDALFYERHHFILARDYDSWPRRADWPVPDSVRHGCHQRCQDAQRQ